jgi:hypothetical protein
MKMSYQNYNKNKTAITRTKPSVPMRLLAEKELLVGTKLDYGCGKGFDADHFEMDKFDTFFNPTHPTKKYDTITCNYVLNVCPIEDEAFVLKHIEHLLNDTGIAYITVRRDIKKEGFTSKKTYQRNVFLKLPVLKETSTYCTYVLYKKHDCETCGEERPWNEIRTAPGQDYYSDEVIFTCKHCDRYCEQEFDYGEDF